LFTFTHFIQERGWWKDVRNNQHNEKEEISQGREQSEEKSQAKPDDNTSHRRGGFSDRKVDQPPTSRKGPAFREKNIPVDSENVNLTATVTVKSTKFDHPLERKERKEGKSSNPYHLDRPEKQFANDRAPCKDKTGRGVSVKRKA
jgi:endo-1,4-beta-xylanase